MCITKECADPTSPGVWWREDDKWIRYNAQHSEAILASFRQLNNSTHPQQTVLVPLGSIASCKHPSGHSYTVVLPELVQRNDRSGYTREVKIVDASVNKPASGAVVTSAQANSKGGRVNTVWFEDDDGTWQPLDFDMSAQVFADVAAGKQCTTLSHSVSVDLSDMKLSVKSPGDCGICGSKIQTDPHALSCGHSFCAVCIFPWTRRTTTAPKTAKRGCSAGMFVCPFRCAAAQSSSPVPFAQHVLGKSKREGDGGHKVREYKVCLVKSRRSTLAMYQE